MEKTREKTKKESSEHAKARANRVRSLRDALRYSREAFCQKHAKYGVTVYALQSWEAIRWNGLTEDGARRLAACFKDEGLNVTVEWLMFGIGEDALAQAVKKGLAKLLPQNNLNRVAEPIPQYSLSSTQQATPEITALSEKEIISQELKLFHQLNPGCTDAIVTDDGLAPWLTPGDHVAGHRYFDNDMERGINHPCIIQTLPGNTLIRLLKPGNDIGYYDLLCTNAETNADERKIENIKLFSIAPIIWIRKPWAKK